MKMFARSTLVAAVSMLSAACSPLALLNATVPSDTYELTPDIAYGAAARQKLDIYRVRDGRPAAGVIVFFYGGSWRRGNRAGYRFVGEAFARRGYVTVIPDYRVYPDVKFPAFVEDAALALRWVRDNIAHHGGTADKIFVMGHSAGAHIGALLALDRRYLAAVGLDDTVVRGVVGIAGPYAFDPARFASTRPIFANTTDARSMRPVNFARGDAPPFLLLHGDDDRTVFPLNTDQMTAALRAAGAPVTRASYPETGHVEILIALSKTLEGRVPLHDDIAGFLAGNGAAPR